MNSPLSDPPISDSPKMLTLRRRPELPRMFTMDKIQQGNSFNNCLAFKTSINHNQKSNEDSNEISMNNFSQMLKTFEFRKKITLKSFELNSYLTTKTSSNLLSRNQTFVFPKNQQPTNELKTCKVQPINIILKETHNEVNRINMKNLTKSSSMRVSSGVNEVERNPISFNKNKLLKSESETNIQLKYFSLRKPKILNNTNISFGCENWNSQVRSSKSFNLDDRDDDDDDRDDDDNGGNNYDDGCGQITKGPRIKAEFNERCRKFLSEKKSFNKKPPISLKRQESIDLLDNEMFEQFKTSRSRTVDDMNRGKQIFQVENNLSKFRNAEERTEFLDNSMSDMILKSFQLNSSFVYRNSTQNSTRGFHPNSPKNCKPSLKSSKCSKVSKNKITSSFVRNVPALLTGLRKSLPHQNPTNHRPPPSLSSSSSLSLSNMNKKFTSFPSPMLRNKKFQNKFGNNSLPAKNDSFQTSSSSPSTTRSHLEKMISIDKKQRGRTSITSSLETCLNNVSRFSTSSEDVNKRDQILKEFIISEKQYVETLRMLVEKYMLPLKSESSLDEKQVDEIFYKIQEIYVHHATLITFLAKSLDPCHVSTVGDVIFKHFSKETVVDCYVSFINHFPRVEKVLHEVSTKSSFVKFIEQCEKETNTKLPLSAQLVKPVQRIPRYGLLLKRLLENTPMVHPDYPLLIQAQSAIHDLALKINEVSRGGSTAVQSQIDTLKKLELLLITDLVGAGRYYVRNDMVSLDERPKDHPCCMWLFNDIIVFTSFKRKTFTSNTILLTSVSGNDYVDNVKHKTWLKVTIKEATISHGTLNNDKMKEDPDDDHQILTDSHFSMDEAVDNVAMEIGKKDDNNNNTSSSSSSSSLQHHIVLLFNLIDKPHHLSLTFATLEKQMNWERAFNYYKNKSESS